MAAAVATDPFDSTFKVYVTLDIYSPVPVPSEFPSCVRESLVR